MSWRNAWANPGTTAHRAESLCAKPVMGGTGHWPTAIELRAKALEKPGFLNPNLNLNPNLGEAGKIRIRIKIRITKTGLSERICP